MNLVLKISSGLGFLCLMIALAIAYNYRSSSPVVTGIDKSIQFLSLKPMHPDYSRTSPGDWLRSDRLEWQSTRTESIPFGFSHEVHWLRLELKTDHLFSAGDYAIEVGQPWIDQVLLFYQDEQGYWQSQQAGDSVSPSHQQFRRPTFIMQLRENQRYECWFRISGLDNIVVKLQIKPLQQHYNESLTIANSFGFFYGTLAVLLLLNLGIYLIAKQSDFLIYSLWLGSYMLTQLTLDGFLRQYVASIDASFFNRLYPALTFATFALGGLFAIRFMNVQRYQPVFGRILFSLITCNFALSLATLFIPEYGAMMKIALMFGSVFAPLIMLSVIQPLRAGSRSAIFFLASWLPLVIAIVFHGLKAFGMVGLGQNLSLHLYLGILLENLILTLALGDKLRRAFAQKKLQDLQLKAASVVQSTLLHHRLEYPNARISSWYQAAEFTCGDWYGCFSAPDESQLLIFMADVSGHGLSSTLLTSMVAGAIHDNLQNHELFELPAPKRLETIVQRINRLVLTYGYRLNLSMTMNLITIDLATGSAHLLNAGHCFPVIRRQGGQQKILAAGGSLLGMQEILQYQILPFSLSPGDELILYTDGFFENITATGNRRFSMDRCLKQERNLKNDRALLENLVWLYQQNLAGSIPLDDASLLILRIIDQCPEEPSLTNKKKPSMEGYQLILESS